MEIVLALVAIAIIAMMVKPYKVAKEYYIENIPKLLKFLKKILSKLVLGIASVASVIFIFSWIGFVIWSVFIAGY
tara:strand:- start:66 stop:290 length:225 start_codon:yes stop_codon:yes gene_type:complete